MERLHKRSRIGLLLSILLALSACAAQPHPAGSTAQLQWLTNQRPDGVYVTAGGLLTWFDYTSQSAAYLCAQPNCAHDTDACTARPPLGPGGQGTSIRGCYAAGERLILAVSDGEVSSIWTAGADGGDRRLLVDWTAGEVWPRLTDGSSLYYTCAVPGDTRYGAQYAMEPMKLYGAGSGQVLLACAMRDTSRPAMAADGSLYETWERETQYGLLSTADFFASRQNWAQVDAGCQIDFGWAWQPE